MESFFVCCVCVPESIFVFCGVGGGQVRFIENADATPPHLKVFPAVGRLSRSAWFCEVLCDGQLSVFFQKESCARF